jgi:hypothetical protein
MSLENAINRWFQVEQAQKDRSVQSKLSDEEKKQKEDAEKQVIALMERRNLNYAQYGTGWIKIDRSRPSMKIDVDVATEVFMDFFLKLIVFQRTQVPDERVKTHFSKVSGWEELFVRFCNQSNIQECVMKFKDFFQRKINSAEAQEDEVKKLKFQKRKPRAELLRNNVNLF